MLVLLQFIREFESKSGASKDRIVKYITCIVTNCFVLAMHVLLTVVSCSSIASPICQKGHSERTFPIFYFSSRFFLFFPDFSLFSPVFVRFFTVRGGTLPSRAPSGYAAGLMVCQLCDSQVCQAVYA